jgi:hypothetical protein
MLLDDPAKATHPLLAPFQRWMPETQSKVVGGCVPFGKAESARDVKNVVGKAIGEEVALDVGRSGFRESQPNIQPSLRPRPGYIGLGTQFSIKNAEECIEFGSVHLVQPG